MTRYAPPEILNSALGNGREGGSHACYLWMLRMWWVGKTWHRTHDGRKLLGRDRIADGDGQRGGTQKGHKLERERSPLGHQAVESLALPRELLTALGKGKKRERVNLPVNQMGITVGNVFASMSILPLFWVLRNWGGE
jgi:hypothetical protein